MLSAVGFVTSTLTLLPLISAAKVGVKVVVDDPSGAKLVTDPNVEINAFVPSCVTLASTNSYLLFSVSVQEM